MSGVAAIRARLSALLAWLAAPAARRDDSPDERVRHVFLVALALLMSMGGLLWGVLCLGLGAVRQSAIPFGYVVLTVGNLGALRLHRSFVAARNVQLFASLVLPFALQWALGGFQASGIMMLWSLVSLVGALTVQSARTTIRWLGTFLVLTLLSYLVDPFVHRHVVVATDEQAVAALVLNVSIITTIVFGLMVYFVRSVERLTEALARSNHDNEVLVRRMLPNVVADRLKGGEVIIADQFEEATVVFCDIVGFTDWAREASPIAVVETLRGVFGRFDDLTRRHGLEKIKTIGDAYMAASGVPVAQPDHRERALALAFDLIRTANEVRTPQGQPLRVRVGLETGPVVAGVIGQDKVLYDIWGATVNMASRLESNGVPGAVHVTRASAALLCGVCPSTPREPMQIKGVGLVETCLLLPPGAQPPAVVGA